MSGAVVDTDVISFVFKGDTRAFLYAALLRQQFLMISFMTEAELERWALQSRWGEGRVQRLRRYISRFAIVPSSRDLARKWADVMWVAQQLGRPIDCADAWIAATALLYEVPPITHNQRDYLGIPSLTLLSPGP